MSGRGDLGLLVIRIGVGLSMLLFHGWGKITGGPDSWSGLGANMARFGIRFFPAFWGLLAASAESLGSALIVLGLFFRPAAAVLAFNMLVAAVRHLSLPANAPNAGWSGASHALEYLAVYVGLLFLGPGRYSVGGKLPGWKRKGR